MARASTLAKIAVVVLVILVLVSCTGLLWPLQTIFYLCFGWLPFLRRVIPNVTINWDNGVLGLLALVAFAMGSHYFLRWFYRSFHFVNGNEGGDLSVPGWRGLWSVGVLSLVIVMFVAGIAMVGIGHQAVWLVSAQEPLLTNQFGDAVGRMQSASNLKQIAIAISNYHADAGTMLPGATMDPSGRLSHGWQTQLLPYVEFPRLYDKIDLRVPWNEPANRHAFQVKVSWYLIPRGGLPYQDDTGYSLSHYSSNVHVIGGTRSRSFAEIPDGTSQTILAGEVRENFRPWGSATNWRDPALGVNGSANGFGSPWRGGANFVMVDGSIRFLSEKTDPTVLKALATPAGSEVVPD